jgi:hypothetical protein
MSGRVSSVIRRASPLQQIHNPMRRAISRQLVRDPSQRPTQEVDPDRCVVTSSPVGHYLRPFPRLSADDGGERRLCLRPLTLVTIQHHRRHGRVSAEMPNLIEANAGLLPLLDRDGDRSVAQPMRPHLRADG